VELFDRLFPQGFAGDDVIAELAPEGWAQSPLLACFHPSVERVFEESLATHRNLSSLWDAVRRRDGTTAPEPPPEPTLEEVRRDYRPSSIKQDEEVTELVGLCLWDVFSDNHDVVAADGRIADIGSFRGAGAFLDGYLARDEAVWERGDYMRFYMGTIRISQRADLAPVYAMIFLRLRALHADWVYSFPELHIVEFARPDDTETSGDVHQGAVADLDAQKHRADVERLKAELGESNAQAREDAIEQPPPPTVRAYREVYGRDPRGWPPA
jgi:hypothetical protein